jgi:hypothetical protein
MAKRTSQTGTRPSDPSATTNKPESPSGDFQAPVSAAPQTGSGEHQNNLDMDATRNDSMGSEPSEEEIRIRAYRRYLDRGGADGLDFEDWLEAERELKG